MSGIILSFPGRRPLPVVPAGWLPNELAECYRVVGLLARGNLHVSMQTGTSDEGDPWAVIVRDDTGDVLVHLARIDGSFIVSSAAGPAVQRGRDLRAVVEAAIASSPLASLPARSNDRLLLHPATILAAFIVTAWTHTEAKRLEGGAETRESQEPAPATVAPDTEIRVARAGDGGPSPSIVAQAAMVLAIVVAAVEAALRTDTSASVDLDTFVQAALAHEAPRPPADAGGVAAPPPMLAWAGPELHVTTPPPNDLAPADDRAAPGHAEGPATLPIMVAEAAEPMSVAQTVSLPPTFLLPEMADQADAVPWRSSVAWVEPDASDTPVVTSGSEGSRRADVSPQAVASVPESTAPRGAAPDLDLVTISGFGTVYETAARLLHLLPDDRLADEEAPASSSAVAVTTSQATTVPSEATASPTTSSQPSSTPAAAPTLPLAPAAAPTPAPAPAAAPTPAPASNADILFNFTNDMARHGTGPAVSWGNLLAGDKETAAARQALVFDASWLAGRVFMLMPGVVMVEDDLLGGTARAQGHFAKAPVTLGLGDNLFIKLVGVIDLPA